LMRWSAVQREGCNVSSVSEWSSDELFGKSQSL
jgi:hypothetical protein